MATKLDVLISVSVTGFLWWKVWFFLAEGFSFLVLLLGEQTRERGIDNSKSDTHIGNYFGYYSLAGEYPFRHG